MFLMSQASRAALDLDYVHAVPSRHDRNKANSYFRRKKVYKPLPGVPGSPEWFAAYTALPAGPGTQGPRRGADRRGVLGRGHRQLQEDQGLHDRREIDEAEPGLFDRLHH
jgi:hypothetical protein